MAGIIYRDEIVIYRVISSNTRDARRFLARLKKQMKEQFEQEEILMVERDIKTL